MKIGHQHGATAAANRLRDMDPGGTKLIKKGGSWPSIDSLPNQGTQEGWGAWDKIERSWKISFHDHDAALEVAERPPPVEPPPVQPPTPTYAKVAPRVAYQAGGSDARFCVYNQPGVSPSGPNEYRDESGATYDENGLCKNGVRSGAPAATSALEIDGRDYCDLPRMGEPHLNTGSWAI